MGHPAFFAGVANTRAHSLDSLPDRPVLTQGRLARTYPTVGVLTQTLSGWEINLEDDPPAPACRGSAVGAALRLLERERPAPFLVAGLDHR
jgi:hypothetical protein